MYTILYKDLIKDEITLIKELNYFNTKNLIHIITNVSKENIPKFQYHEYTEILLSDEDIEFVKISIIKI